MYAIVVSYNSHSELLKCLPRYRLNSIPTVVVENGDYDSTIHGIADFYLQGHGNIGYGSAVNLGFEFMQAVGDTKYDWVLIANADALPSDLLLQCATSSACLEPADLWGFRNSSGGRSYGLMPSPLNTVLATFLGEARAIQWRGQQHAYPIGALLAIRCSTFERIAGFDPRYFLYYEEVDLWRRVGEAGFVRRFAPEDLSYAHLGAASTKKYSLAAGFERGRSTVLYYRSSRTMRLRAWMILEFFHVTLVSLRWMCNGRLDVWREQRAVAQGILLELFAEPTASAQSFSSFARPNQVCGDRGYRGRPTPPRRALFLVFEDPREHTSGASLRNWATLQGLIREFDVRCVVTSGQLRGPVRDQNGMFIAGRSRSLFGTATHSLVFGQQWMTARYDTRFTRSAIASNLEGVELVVASMINAATIAARELKRAKRASAALVWDTQNYDPELWSASASAWRGIRRALAEREERRSVSAALALRGQVDAVVAVSERDQASWRSLLGIKRRVSVAPNGADTQAWKRVATVPVQPGLFASFGSLAQDMTADGLVDFLRDWPALNDQLGDVTLLLAGRAPRADVVKTVNLLNGVRIVADPVDMVEAVSKAELFIFPQVRGYGSKIKMYEALATGRPIVASPAAIIGIPSHLQGNVFIVSDRGWVNAILAARASGTSILSTEDLQEISVEEQIKSLAAVYSSVLPSDRQDARGADHVAK